MSDPNTGDPAETGLDKGTGDPNADRAFLDDMPPAQVVEDDDLDSDSDSDSTDADA